MSSIREAVVKSFMLSAHTLLHKVRYVLGTGFLFVWIRFSAYVTILRDRGSK